MPPDSEWAAWLAQHAPALLLFARQQARHEADAQDLVQDAVVESWRHQDDGALPPLGLVYATIRHRAIDLARREERRLDREVAAHLDHPPVWFDSGFEERERRLLLQKATTIIQTSKDGTLIIDTGAKNHLTARDKDGKMLFDGDVDIPRRTVQSPPPKSGKKPNQTSTNRPLPPPNNSIDYSGGLCPPPVSQRIVQIQTD
jgi:hypothetical protein